MTTKHLFTADKRTVLWMFTGLCAGLAIVLMFYIVTGIYGLATTIRNSQQSNTSTVNLIRDCTQPTGKCYQRSQAQTGDAIAVINRVSIYAAACADRAGNRGNITRIQTCVLDRIDQDNNNKKLNNTTTGGGQ